MNTPIRRNICETGSFTLRPIERRYPCHLVLQRPEVPHAVFGLPEPRQPFFRRYSRQIALDERYHTRIASTMSTKRVKCVESCRDKHNFSFNNNKIDTHHPLTWRAHQLLIELRPRHLGLLQADNIRLQTLQKLLQILPQTLQHGAQPIDVPSHEPQRPLHGAKTSRTILLQSPTDCEFLLTNRNIWRRFPRAVPSQTDNCARPRETYTSAAER